MCDDGEDNKSGTLQRGKGIYGVFKEHVSPI